MCLDGITESRLSDRGEQKMPEEQSEPLWIVVKVESGIPVTVEAYRDGLTAETREQSLRWCMHPENDETGIFEVQIGHAELND